MFNEIEYVPNVMDFDTFVANVNAYLWNEFANELGFINEIIFYVF